MLDHEQQRRAIYLADMHLVIGAAMDKDAARNLKGHIEELTSG